MRSSFISDLRKIQMKLHEIKSNNQFKVSESIEQLPILIRDGYGKIDSPIIGSWYPVTFDYNGTTYHLMANQKREKSPRKTFSKLDIVIVNEYPNDEVRFKGFYYELDGDNNLKFIIRSYTPPGQLSKWKNTKFPLDSKPLPI
jgi:hypothetical protein